jgi:DNA repair exonuclease SbcCD nuclease subunit
MSYLIVGDLHIGKGMAIGKPQPGQLNSRIQDQINLLNWVDELSDKNNITEIFFTGDIFQDPKPHPTIIGILFRSLKRLQTKRRKLILLEEITIFYEQEP